MQKCSRTIAPHTTLPVDDRGNRAFSVHAVTTESTCECWRAHNTGARIPTNFREEVKTLKDYLFPYREIEIIFFVLGKRIKESRQGVSVRFGLACIVPIAINRLIRYNALAEAETTARASW